MKKNIVVLFCFVLLSCSSENIWNCVQSVGDIVEEEIPVTPFSRITVEDDIFLTVQQGDEYKVVVKTGANLLNDIKVTQEGDVLRLQNENRCNLTREYDVTFITVITPELNEIRSASYNEVRNVGVLTFPELILGSNTNPGVITAGKSGDFILNVDSQRIRVEANGQSEFKITGITEVLDILFSDEIPKFSGAGLVANEVKVVHRSANTITVNPQQKLSGILLSTGDLISVNEPPIVEVEENFTGHLIFQ